MDTPSFNNYCCFLRITPGIIIIINRNWFCFWLSLFCQEYNLVIHSAECITNAEVIGCCIKLLNKTHVNSDVIVRRTVYDSTMHLNIAQITDYNKGRNRRTVIFNRKFQLCNKNLFGMTDYFSLYVVSIINSFFNGTELKCPLTQQTFSIRNFSLNFKFLPWQFFYKPKSYMEVNGTFFEVCKLSTVYMGTFFLKVEIQKTFS